MADSLAPRNKRLALLEAQGLARSRGTNPESFLDALARIVRLQVWTEMTDEQEAPIGSLARLLLLPQPYGLGVSAADLRHLVMVGRTNAPQIDDENEREGEIEAWDALETMRFEVLKALDEATPAAKPEGRPKHETVNSYMSEFTSYPSSQGGNSRSAVVARLKRDAADDPAKGELVARVVQRDISAAEAARQAGYRRKTITLPADPEQFALALYRRPDAHLYVAALKDLALNEC